MFPINLEVMTILERTIIWVVLMSIMLLALAVYSYFQDKERE